MFDFGIRTYTSVRRNGAVIFTIIGLNNGHIFKI